MMPRLTLRQPGLRACGSRVSGNVPALGRVELSSFPHCPCRGSIWTHTPTPATGRRLALPQTRSLGLGGPWALWGEACPSPPRAALTRRGDRKNVPRGAAHTVWRSR